MLRTKYFLVVVSLSTCSLGFIPSTLSPIRSSTSICSSKNDDPEIQNLYPNVTFKYCTGCKWGLRSSWLQQELLSTFENSNLASVSLQPCRPPEPGGVFIVTVDNKIVWDRKTDGGFPEAKVLKQRVRDIIEPDKDLGHSDVQTKSSQMTNETPVCVECEEAEQLSKKNLDLLQNNPKEEGGVYDIKIQYCTGCKWMLRANYLQMELFSTFQEQLRSISLIPIRPPAPGGIFVSTLINAKFEIPKHLSVTKHFFSLKKKITLNDEVIWDRKADGGFPETKILKQRVRDMIDPEMNLGHSDDSNKNKDVEETVNYLSEEESQQMRNYFGVL